MKQEFAAEREAHLFLGVVGPLRTTRTLLEF